MRIVWKYKLAVEDLQEVGLPEGAEILSVQDQRGTLTIWAMVDPDEKRISPVTIEIIPTGLPVHPADRKHLATVQQENGHLLWHVFQRVGPS